MELEQSLLDLMNKDPKRFENVISQVMKKYKTKYKEMLILKGDDLSLKDGSSPDDFFSSLRMIEDWIQKCIDEIRIYLKPICYPLFVHLYLNLINKHHNHAQIF